MPDKKILCADFVEEKALIESGGRFRVTGQSPIRSEPGYCHLHYEALSAAQARPVRRLTGVAKLTGRVEMSRSRKVARRLFDLNSPASVEPPRVIAERWLRRLAPQLGIDRKLADLKFERIKKSIFGNHVMFQQYVGRTQISGAWVRVDLDSDGRLFNVQNDLVPLAVMTARRAGATRASRLQGDEGKPLSIAQAKQAALEATLVAKGGWKKTIGKPELLYRPSDGDPKLTWKVIVRSGAPTREWKMYIDAFSAKVLWRRNVLKKATKKGRVFDPNPVVALNSTRLSDRDPVPAAAYREVELLGLRNTHHLDGEYVTTRLTKQRASSASGDFRYRRKQRGFTEVMVYFHIDRAQRYLQALGFDNILTRAIPVNVAGQREDNSWYSPNEKLLSFGTGGVDDAEDGETILHEYGHAMQDAQVPGFGDSDECAAMGEGFGDFLAASFFADRKSAWLRPAISSWDCIDWPGDPPCLRRLDSNKRFPRDVTGEVHADGEIWSACLWQLRHELGRTAAERLVIAHHYMLNRWAGFEDAANALLTTDRQLFDGRNHDTIRHIFVQRGILPDTRRGGRRTGARFEG